MFAAVLSWISTFVHAARSWIQWLLHLATWCRTANKVHGTFSWEAFVVALALQGLDVCVGPLPHSYPHQQRCHPDCCLPFGCSEARIAPTKTKACWRRLPTLSRVGAKQADYVRTQGKRKQNVQSILMFVLKV